MPIEDYKVRAFRNHELGAEFRVEQVIDGSVDGILAPDYIIWGPDGAIYTLHRNVRNPHLLFSLNAQNYLKSGMIEGNEWFTDITGHLKPLLPMK